MGEYARDKLDRIVVDDIPDKTCCGVLEAFRAAGFSFPFSCNSAWNRKTGETSKGHWNVMLMESTPRGKPATGYKQQMKFVMHYCPFCGAEIFKEPESA